MPHRTVSRTAGRGSNHTQVIAAKAIRLGEALQPEFRDFARQVKANAAKLAAVLADGGIEIVTGGTDTHIVLLDLSRTGLTGEAAENILEGAGITSNKNPIPFDVASPARWSGLRLGVVAATTRGFGEPEFETVGRLIAALLSPAGKEGSGTATEANRTFAGLCRSFPVYSVARNRSLAPPR